jgi:hypothetical protein
MLIFRNIDVRNAMALFTGLIFLNMSFFLAEVSALGLTKDKKMLKNIALLISSSAAEEEKDAFGGMADEDHSTKGVDLIVSYTTHTIYGHGILITKTDSHDQGLPLLGSYEIYSPPPEA